MTRLGDRHLGLLVYCWGLDEQSRLIAGGLAPVAAELREHGLRRFWFDRFDARGPHVFALFTVRAERFAMTEELVEERLAFYVSDHPSLTHLSPDELAERHQACRGIALCAVDAEEGIAANNTLRCFEQPGDRYPFSLGRGLADPEVLWDLLDGLAAWSVERLAAAPVGPPIGIATCWLAALFDVLPCHFHDPQAYWEHHATSLARRLERLADGEEMARRLTLAVGGHNDAVLTRIWQQARSSPSLWPSLPRLVEAVAGADGTRGPGPNPLLREIVHMTMRQLGVPTRLEKILLLFCWRESLKAAPRAETG